MSAPWIADVAADAFRGVNGFKVDVVSGWRTRSAKTQSFAPIGVMNHHTGPGSYGALLNYMAYNASTAPLCNIATSIPYNGIVRITIVAAGRANHGGKGYYSWTGRDGANYRCIGIENQNNGSQAWTKQQTEATRILTAALLKHMNRGTNYMIEHKTYAPSRKPDRHTINLGTERKAVGALMASKPTPEKESFLMALSDKEQDQLKDRIYNIHRELMKGEGESGTEGYVPDGPSGKTIRIRTWQTNKAMGQLMGSEVNNLKRLIRKAGEGNQQAAADAEAIVEEIFNKIGSLAKADTE